MKVIESLAFIPEHLGASLTGCFRTRDPRMIWERLRYTLTRHFSPFVTQQGYNIDTVQQLVSWWELAHEQKLFRGWDHLIKEGSMFLDIGANFGIFGFMCRRKWPKCKLIAIEPHPKTAQYCRDLGIYDQVIQCAVSDKPGTITLHMADGDGFTGSTHPCYRCFEEISVDARRLDDLGLFPEFIKMDIDGAEIDAINGGLKTFRQARGCVVETVYPERVREIQALLNKPFRRQVTSIDYVYF